MLALHAEQRPAFSVACRLLASMFGAAGVRTGGAIYTRLEGRGKVRGLTVRVVMSMQRTRTGTAPYTAIHVEEDLDAVVYTGGAGWPYPDHEAFSPFHWEKLENTAAVGAPRSLLSRITHGPIGARLAMSGLARLSIGSEAKRDGCATRGVFLDLEGWPFDEATLRFVVDTAIEIALAARQEGSHRLAEIAAYESARAADRAKGLRVVAATVAGLAAVASCVAFAMIRVM